MNAAGRHVLLAGGSSDAGLAVTRALIAAGARVTVTGRSTVRLAPLVDAGALTVVADATSLLEMSELAAELTDIDAVIPLVGGWRGGGGLTGQTNEDLHALMPAFDAVRATSRAFDSALRASDAGRFAIVSSTAAGRPLAGGANYAAVKAASEAWTRAVAQGYAKAARESSRPQRAAALIWRVKALDPAVLAAAAVALWDAEASELNDRVVVL